METSNPDTSSLDGANQRASPGYVVPKRDETLFLEWDFAVIQAGDTIFRVPRQPLIELSQPLRDLMVQGSTEANPIVLHDIDASEFRNFLRMVFPGFVSDTSIFQRRINCSAERWLTVLKVSTKFRCLRLRKEALMALDSLWAPFALKLLQSKSDPIKMIQMGRRFWVLEWVTSGYKTLVEREDTISDEEMLEIGTISAFLLVRLREESKTSHRVDRDVARAIQKVFQQEFISIAAEEKKYEVVN